MDTGTYTDMGMTLNGWYDTDTTWVQHIYDTLKEISMLPRIELCNTINNIV